MESHLAIVHSSGLTFADYQAARATFRDGKASFNGEELSFKDARAVLSTLVSDKDSDTPLPRSIAQAVAVFIFNKLAFESIDTNQNNRSDATKQEEQDDSIKI